MIDVHAVTFLVIFAGLFGAIVWDLITWYFGLPTSSSHALIGGYAGGAVAHAGLGVIIPSGWTKTLIFIVLAPTIGLVLGFALMTAIYWIFRGFAPSRVDRWFRRLQLVSASLYSLGHGANDAQKTMGIIAGVLFAAGYIQHFYIPMWVVLSAHAAIALGTLSGGWRIIHTMGIEDHASAAGRRIRGRNGRCGVALHRHGTRRSGQYHAHDHGRDRRRRRDTAVIGRALGHSRPDRLGVDPDDPDLGPDLVNDLLGAVAPAHAAVGPTVRHALALLSAEGRLQRAARLNKFGPTAVFTPRRLSIPRSGCELPWSPCSRSGASPGRCRRHRPACG